MNNQLNQSKTPLFTALERHQSKERISLHVPGHKAGRGLPADFASYVGVLARLDATELPGLDDLHNPKGVIKEAQELAAAAWGSSATFFLVGGSTVGNLVAVLGSAKPGDTVIVARNAHQSIWHALQLARVRVVVATPEAIGPLPGALTTATVKKAIQAFPEASLLILTSPTYHGVVSELNDIVQVAHENGLKVIVDEAHGAHLVFHPQLPISGITAGADVVVQSAHKMTAALTQTGLLHTTSKHIDVEKIQENLRIFQSSSPSYLLLASIDVARAELAVHGRQLLDDRIHWLQESRQFINEALPGLVNGGFPEAMTDPFKWTLWADEWGLSGEQLAIDMKRAGISVELYDEHHVLCVWSYANSKTDIERVRDVILHLFQGRQREAVRATDTYWGEALPEVSLLQIDSSGNSPRLGILKDLVGKRAVRGVTVYPPGIPVVLPGESFTANVLQYIKTCAEYGLRIDGLTYEPEGCTAFVYYH